MGEFDDLKKVKEQEESRKQRDRDNRQRIETLRGQLFRKHNSMVKNVLDQYRLALYPDQDYEVRENSKLTDWVLGWKDLDVSDSPRPIEVFRSLVTVTVSVDWKHALEAPSPYFMHFSCEKGGRKAKADFTREKLIDALKQISLSQSDYESLSQFENELNDDPEYEPD